MTISGLQKLTLLDFPGKVACTVFTAGCNLRCPFCHNAELVEPGQAPAPVDEEAFFALLAKRKGVLDGVCVTGGEPLFQPGLPAFLERVKALGYAVKLDTNGFFPERLKELVRAGLVDRVAMDVKNSREGYAETAGVPNLDLSPLEETVAFLRAGRLPFEFRTTVVREFHDGESFRSIGAWLAGDEPYFLQHFEDSGMLLEEGLHGCERGEMERFRQILLPCLPNTELRGV